MHLVSKSNEKLEKSSESARLPSLVHLFRKVCTIPMKTLVYNSQHTIISKTPHPIDLWSRYPIWPQKKILKSLLFANLLHMSSSNFYILNPFHPKKLHWSTSLNEFMVTFPGQDGSHPIAPVRSFATLRSSARPVLERSGQLFRGPSVGISCLRLILKHIFPKKTNITCFFWKIRSLEDKPFKFCNGRPPFI